MNKLLALLIVSLTLLVPALQAEETIPHSQDAIMEQVGVDQKIGDTIPLGLTFQDSAGETVQLNKYFHKKPVILVPVYFECPMLCNLVLNGLFKALNLMKFTAARDFSVVIFSISPTEDSDLAKQKKTNYLTEFNQLDNKDGWHFLTGTQDVIGQLTEAMGFRYAYDKVSGEYAHAAATLVLTPSGKISFYFPGIEFSPRDLRFALIEASGGKIGSAIDFILMTCYHYDPLTGKYGLVISRVMRLMGIITVAIILGFIVFSLKNERQKKN